MKLERFVTLALFAAAIAVNAQAQTTGSAPVEAKLPVEIIKHKIGLDYYPMLDRPSSMSAESGDLPVTENERLARQNSRVPGNKVASAPTAPGGEPRRGRLRSYTRVIDAAEYVQVELRNTDQKTIKAIEWDFAFPRYENGQLQLRFDVTSKAEIKPGGKKTLKHKLPPSAKKCEVVRVQSDESHPDKVSTFEAVCGQGFHDPSLLNQKQETITIKRIEFIDGSVWERKS